MGTRQAFFYAGIGEERTSHGEHVDAPDQDRHAGP